MSSNISAQGAIIRARAAASIDRRAAKKPRTDGAKAGKRILDVGQQSSHASVVLEHVLAKLKSGETLLKKDIAYLETAKASIDHIDPQLRSLVPQVALVPHLVSSYDASTAQERAEMRVAEKMGKGTEAAVHCLSSFNKSIVEKATVLPLLSPAPLSSSPATPAQLVRASSRVSIPVLPIVVTPPPKSADDILNKSRIGTADVVSVLSSGRSYDERKVLIKRLLGTGNLIVGGITSPDVTRTMLWDAYAERTIPKPLGFCGGQKVYGKDEMKEHLMQFVLPGNARSEELTARIKAFIRTGVCHTKSPETIRSILRKESNRPVGVTGRPKIDRDVVMEDVQSVKQYHGSMHDEDDVKSSLSKAAIDAAAAAGKSVLSIDPHNAVSTSTARRAAVECAMAMPGINLTDKEAIEKDASRWINENSARNAICHAFVVALAHYFVLPGKNRPLPPGYHDFDVEKLSDGAKRLYHRIQRRNPASTIVPVHPALVMGTDETGLVVVDGVAEENKWKWRLVDASADAGAHSYYTEGGDSAKPGILRVKLCITTNAIGMVAAIWIVVSGLTEAELPREHCPHGIHVVPIEGLCREYAKDPSAKGLGFICLTRKTTSEDDGVSIAQRKFREYEDQVFGPFVDKCRRLVDTSYNGGDASAYPHLRVASWTDGDGPQIKQQLEDLAKSRSSGILRLKTGARCSGVQAAADLQRTHANAKAVNKRKTASQLKVNNLKDRVVTVLKGLKEDGKLKLLKERQLVEIVATAPDIYDEAVTKRGVKCGFETGGFIDKASGWAADESLLLKTCQKGLSEHDDIAYENGWDSGDPETDFYGIVSEKGKIPEGALDAAAVDEDKDKAGNLVLRLQDGIQQLDRQRSLILTHDDLVRQMKQKSQKAEDEKYEVAMLEVARVNSILDKVNEIETNLVATLPTTGTVAGNHVPTRRKMAEVADKSLRSIADLSPAQLKMVIGAYLSDSGTKPTGEKWPNKYPTASSGRKNLEHIKEVLDRCPDQSFKEHCLVSLVASVYRDRLERKLKPREEPQRNTTDPFGRQHPHVATVTNIPASASLPNADVILNDGEVLGKFDSAIKVLMMKESVRLGNASAEEVERAKQVTTILRQRHAGYKEGKLKEVGLGDKANHAIFKFAEDNFHFGGALLVAYEMVKEELDFVSSGDAVLKAPSDGAFVDITGDILMYWGAYMYADMSLMAWIRSGKACGGTEESGRFKARILAHLKAAKNEALGKGDGKITFYQRYVSKAIDSSTKEHVMQASIARGYHEDLKVKVGFAVDPNSDYSSLCDGSTFIWSRETLEYLSKKDRAGLKTLNEKQCELICYFWEHMLELLMEKDKNVSWSAGWEAYIGVGKVGTFLDLHDVHVVGEEESEEEDE